MDYASRVDMGGDGKFTDGNPGVAPASFDKADDQNQVYDELITVIEGGGLTPNFANRVQVLAGIDARWKMRFEGLEVTGFKAFTAFNLNEILKNCAFVINSNANSPLPPGESGDFECHMAADDQKAYQQVVGLTNAYKGRIYRRFLTAGVWDVVWDEILIHRIGDPIMVFGSTPRPGTLELDGALLTRTSYPALWAELQARGLVVIDEAWLEGQTGVASSGNGTTTFRLPDWRGEFLRAWDHGRGADPDAATRSGGDTVGSTQTDELKSHDHSYTRPGPTGAGGGALLGTDYTDATGVTGGNETRSRNVAIMYCIKY